MQPPNGGWSLPCPVCGRPSGDTGTGPCPQCGLPAVGQAALVVARIGATLAELTRDRDALLASLRAAAPGALPSRPPRRRPGCPPRAVAVRSPPPPPWTPQPPAARTAPPRPR